MDLITAAKNGDFDAAFNLLQHGHRANVRDHDNATPLYWAACHGHANLCDLLLEGGSEVNARVKWGSTPLHAAADRNHVECVRILIESGADVNFQNNRGDTALHIAAYRGNSAITRQLLTARSNTALANDKGKTPREEAMEGGHRETADCIDNFVAGRPQNYHQPHNGIEQQPPPLNGVHVAHNAPPTGPPLVPHYGPTADLAITPSSRTNGIQYHPAIFRSMGSGNTSSLNESALSSFSTNSATESYEFTDSGTFSSVPEVAHTKCLNGCLKNGGLKNGGLKRSISVGPHDNYRQPVTGNQPHLLVTKTNSVSNLPYHGYPHYNVFENDVNQSYSSSVESVCEEASKLNVIGEPATGVVNISRVLRTSYSPDISTKLTSNGRCVATESVDDSELRHVDEEEILRHQMPEMRPQSAGSNRPLRASTGSVRDIEKQSESQEEYIKTLQIQLVNAYKEIEKLTQEIDDLNFKCSTVISRLTDTEQLLEDKKKECEKLRELMETQRVKFPGVDTCTQKFKNPRDIETPCCGLLKLSHRLNNDLSDLKQVQKSVQENLLSLSQQPETTVIPEVTNKQWVPGVDYVITGENKTTWLDPRTSESAPLCITFSIKHLKSGSRFVLRMYLLLKNSQAGTWTFEPVLLKSDSSSSRDRLWKHPNSDRPVHVYEGFTDRFKKFVTAPASKCVQLCPRTLFVVTNETKSFRTVLDSINKDSVARDTDVYGSFLEFNIQVAYQVLSLISYLEDSGVVRENISEDTIAMDKTLRPSLSDSNIMLCQYTSPMIPSTDLRDRGTSLNDQTLYKGQCNSDADLRSVCDLFNRVLSSCDTPAHLAGCDLRLRSTLTSALKVIQSASSSRPAQGVAGKTLMHRLGCVVFGPRKSGVHNVKDCSLFLMAQMLQLTARYPEKRYQDQPPDYVSISESVAMRRPEVLAHFLCSISAEELWDVYQYCDRQNWLVP